MRNSSGPAYPIKAVDNALAVLVLLHERGGVRVAEVAVHLAVARSTAHRVLAMLVARGFAVQDGRRVYRPGPALGAVPGTVPGPAGARPGWVPPDLVTVAHPRLRELARAVGETAHLMVREGNGVRFVDGVEGAEGAGVLRVGTRTGMLLPAHVTSGGRALLAELPADELRALYPREVLPGAGVGAGDLAALRRELAAVRRRGYAVNVEESERGVSAAGACVRDAAGRAVAAVAVAAPTVRCPRRRLHELAVEVRHTAVRIGAALPGTGTWPVPVS